MTTTDARRTDPSSRHRKQRARLAGPAMLTAAVAAGVLVAGGPPNVMAVRTLAVQATFPGASTVAPPTTPGDNGARPADPSALEVLGLIPPAAAPGGAGAQSFGERLDHVGAQ